MELYIARKPEGFKAQNIRWPYLDLLIIDDFKYGSLIELLLRTQNLDDLSINDLRCNHMLSVSDTADIKLPFDRLLKLSVAVSGPEKESEMDFLETFAKPMLQSATSLTSFTCNAMSAMQLSRFVDKYSSSYSHLRKVSYYEKSDASSEPNLIELH
ncbi:hypothetical protein GGI07_001815 [Coemansia sp. Benny D115]|nr:hypothetical protein GGI07_001815 [Coemansia sp. Benny D115]